MTQTLCTRSSNQLQTHHPGGSITYNRISVGRCIYCHLTVTRPAGTGFAWTSRMYVIEETPEPTR